MQKVSEELRACRTELETQTTALSRATRDREELAKSKAAVDVRLHSADRRACGLMQELAALRSERVCVTSQIFWANFRFDHFSSATFIAQGHLGLFHRALVTVRSGEE